MHFQQVYFSSNDILRSTLVLPVYSAAGAGAAAVAAAEQLAGATRNATMLTDLAVPQEKPPNAAEVCHFHSLDYSSSRLHASISRPMVFLIHMWLRFTHCKTRVPHKSTA